MIWFICLNLFSHCMIDVSVFVNWVLSVGNRAGQVGSKTHSSVGLSATPATPHTNQGSYICLLIKMLILLPGIHAFLLVFVLSIWQHIINILCSPTWLKHLSVWWGNRNVGRNLMLPGVKIQVNFLCKCKISCSHNWKPDGQIYSRDKLSVWDNLAVWDR